MKLTPWTKYTPFSLDIYGGQRPAIVLKKRHWHRFIPVKFVTFLRTPFFTEHLRGTASKCFHRTYYFHDSTQQFLLLKHLYSFILTDMKLKVCIKIVKKQPQYVFFEKKCSWKCCKFHRKHLCLSLFLIKLQALRPTTLIKKRLH